MIDLAASLLRWAAAGLLIAFSLRRGIFLLASLLPPRPCVRSTARTITVLVPARNEAATLPALLAAIATLDYPATQLHAVLVSDGSEDETAALMEAWPAAAPFPAVAVILPTSRGKGGALAAGLAQAPPSELIAILDADCEPDPDVLQLLAGAFDDPRIGAATAYPRPGNAEAGTVARYAALERWAHHLVVLAAKDRLRLDPPIIGVAFAVRRSALEALGGFPVGRLSEDLELSMALTGAGWKTRWIGAAQVRENVVETAAAFQRQRTRWSRGMLQSTRRISSVEDLFMTAGYLDRAALAAAVVLVPFGIVAWWWPALYLVLPALTALQALRAARARHPWHHLRAAVSMFAADIGVSVQSLLGAAAGTRARWDRRG